MEKKTVKCPTCASTVHLFVGNRGQLSKFEPMPESEKIKEMQAEVDELKAEWHEVGDDSIEEGKYYITLWSDGLMEIMQNCFHQEKALFEGKSIGNAVMLYWRDVPKKPLKVQE